MTDPTRTVTTAQIRGVLATMPVRSGAIVPLTEYADGSARFDSNAGIVGSIKRALTAPIRALRGEIAPDQMIAEAHNFAGLMTLGGAAAPKPSGIVGSAGGRIGRQALDMSPEARMARAKEMGFDTEKTWFHVTDQSFSSFKIRGVMRNTEPSAFEVAKIGVWASDRPDRVASAMGLVGDGARTMPLRVKGDLYEAGSLADVFDLVREHGSAAKLRKHLENRGWSGIRIRDEEFTPKPDRSVVTEPLRKLNEYYGEQNRLYAAGKSAELEAYALRIAEAEAAVRAAESTVLKISPTHSIAVFDPRNIRSVNATFDPARASSANIMAANPATAAAPGLALMMAGGSAPPASMPSRPLPSTPGFRALSAAFLNRQAATLQSASPQRRFRAAAPVSAGSDATFRRTYTIGPKAGITEIVHKPVR